MKKYLVFTCLLFLFGFVNFSNANEDVSFEEYYNNPVFSYSSIRGSFDEMRVYAQEVIKVGDEYRMYYSALGNGNAMQAGLATSGDGINWMRHPENPIFTCGENAGTGCRTGGNWSNFRIEVVTVEYSGGEYKMWYQGDNQNLKATKRLGYATSPDGVNWTAYGTNPIYTAEERNGIRYQAVLPIESGYRLYFTDSVVGSTYYLESPDGLSWSGEPVLVGDQVRFDSVDKVGEDYVAVVGTNIVLSVDGKSFDLENSQLTINHNEPHDHAKVSFLEDGDLIKAWAAHRDGLVTWSYGNHSIHYLTLDKENWPAVGETSLENPYPLYTQIESPYPSASATAAWADDAFAGGATYSCGSTIAQCGCLISSVVSAAQGAGIESDVLGEEVNPGNINAYLESIENGYMSGAMSWLAARAYLGEFQPDGTLASRFQYLSHTGTVGVMGKVNTALAGEKTIFGYKNGHFVWVPEKLSEGYFVRDPFWYNTITANDTVTTSTPRVRDYNDVFTSARIAIFHDEPVPFSGSDIEAVLTSDTAELLFKSVAGEVGYKAGDIVIDLDTASYGNVDAIALNGENEGAPAGRHLLVYGAGEQFSIDVVGTDEGEFELHFFTISEKGTTTAFTFYGYTFPGSTTTFTFDLATGEVVQEAITYDGFMTIFNSLLGDSDLTPQQRRFFARWTQKMFDAMEEKTVAQAVQTIETYQKLLVAKKIDEPKLMTVTDVLLEEVAARE